MKSYKNTLTTWGLVASLAVMSGWAYANTPPISITSQVNELIKQLDERGQERLVAVQADEIIPGDRILYTTRFQNNGAEPSENIVITNPIPAEVTYLPGTARGENCDIVFSIDGGKRWGKPEQLQVRMANGQVRQAKPSEYTHIRWQYRSVLGARQSGQLSYQALLK